MHYFDHAATTPVLPAAADAAYRVMTRDFGNPSSLHALGKQAAKEVEAHRAAVEACAEKEGIPGSAEELLAIMTVESGGEAEDVLLENQQVLRAPIVRNGRQATVGYAPDIWKTWE